MFKINFKKNKKKAQHVVEFAIIMPLFLFAFSFIFPVMAETYRNFKFSYDFINRVTRVIENQPVFNTKGDFYDYSIEHEILNSNIEDIRNANIFIINTGQTSFISGATTHPIKALFGVVGKGYFHFMVPVNEAFLEPSVLNITTGNLDSNFVLGRYYQNEPKIP